MCVCCLLVLNLVSSTLYTSVYSPAGAALGGFEEMCTLHAVIMLCFWRWVTCLMIQPQAPEYSRPFQLILLNTDGGIYYVVMVDDVSFSFWS